MAEGNVPESSADAAADSEERFLFIGVGFGCFLQVREINIGY